MLSIAKACSISLDSGIRSGSKESGRAYWTLPTSDTGSAADRSGFSGLCQTGFTLRYWLSTSKPKPRCSRTSRSSTICKSRVEQPGIAFTQPILLWLADRVASSVSTSALKAALFRSTQATRLIPLRPGFASPLGAGDTCESRTGSYR